MKYTIQHRRGTTAQWGDANPVLAFGEVGIENTGTGLRSKIGDGITAWANLPYMDDKALAAAVTAEANANSHADEGATATLSSAKSYTDAKVAPSLADTGERDVTTLIPAITSGGATISRIGRVVTFTLDTVRFGDLSGTVNAQTRDAIPVGFRSRTRYVYYNTSGRGGSGAMRGIRFDAYGGSNVYDLATGDWLSVTAIWTTAQSFPSTLPGTPA